MHIETEGCCFPSQCDMATVQQWWEKKNKKKHCYKTNSIYCPGDSICRIRHKSCTWYSSFSWLLAWATCWLFLPSSLSVHHTFKFPVFFFLPSWKPWPLKAFFLFLCLVFFWLLLWINLILEELIQEGKAKAVKVWNMCQEKGLFMTWITAIFAFSICSFGRLKLYLKYERCGKKQERHIHPQNIHFCFYNSINSTDFQD